MAGGPAQGKTGQGYTSGGWEWSGGEGGLPAIPARKNAGQVATPLVRCLASILLSYWK